jgi:hypothetical protein
MGSTFSVFHWLVVLAVIGIPIWLGVRLLRARRRGELTNADLRGISGIWGWLALLAFGQCLGFLRSAIVFVQDLASLPDAWQLTAARVPTVVLLSASGAYLALQLWTIIALFKKRKSFPRLFFAYWIASALMVLAMLPLLTVPGVTLDTLAGDIGGQIGVFIGIGIWVWYTRVSVRVKNTFVT